MRPLQGIRVLDFSTLLPGPMATLILAEAGAEVIKVERPGKGEDMRWFTPAWAPDGGSNFALLNRGKRSLAIDLKEPGAVDRLRPLLETAHVLVEQFRPGVMQRLGLGYDAVRKLNPRIVYCAITGYGQTGPKAQVAAHDLNYIGETGLAALAAEKDGAPPVPPALIADIGGGAMPAVVNILLALRDAERTGEGRFLDVAMADSIFAFSYWAQGMQAQGIAPVPGGETVTGGSPRYRVYRAADGKYLAVAPLEQKFWETFCAVIDLDPKLRDDSRDPAATIAAIAARIAARTAADWERLFAGKDACVSVIKTIGDAMEDPHFRGRGLFDRAVTAAGKAMPALPVGLAPVYADQAPRAAAMPALGEANAELLKR